LCTSVEGLAELQILQDLSAVSIEVGHAYLGYHAEISFDLARVSLNRYTIEGRDPQIVNGVTKTVEEKLKEQQVPHQFAYKDRYIAILDGVFSFFVALIALRIGQITRIWTPNDPLGASFGLAFFVFLIGAWPMSHLIKWLFPYFTYDEDRDARKRQVAKGTFCAIFLSLFASFLFDMILRLR
jgi:hypothetical protein